MDLDRAVRKFAENPILKWDYTNSVWVPTGIKGSLAVYDRFISDRAFGQTKRIILTALEDHLNLAEVKGVYMMEGNSARFMLESVNEDTMMSVNYANVYMAHDVAYPVEIKKNSGTARASGIAKKDTPVVVDTTWCDYNRYSAVNSSDMPSVDYTTINLFLPRGTIVDTDCFVELDGGIFDVNEISTSLNILICRAQRRGV